MCGIVGIFDSTGQGHIDRQILEKMNATQFHRGPNEGGIHVEPGLGFGHRRLSIIDLSSGQQPLFNRDRTVVVTYNGEIYNFMEVRRELEQLGFSFSTHCDTEVIVYAWEAWGKQCVDRFRGMFAFAIWDRPKQTLFLARDRLGVKPLYYTKLADGQFVFSSELKALMVHPGVSRRIDPTAVEDFFAFGYVPDPKSIYQDIHKLAPGCRLLIKRGESGFRPEEYWDIPFKVQANLSFADAEAQLLEYFREAVQIRMVADVPLGAFLSGGVDSSAVVAMMAEASPNPVNTCSISFGDPAFNESTYAEKVAGLFKTHHRSEQVDPADYSLVDRLASLYDEPFADPSALPTYRVCELAKREVTVALSGDGGDENFAGYRRYRWHAYEESIRSRIPLGIRRPVFGFLGSVYPKIDWAPRVLRAKSTFEALARDSVEGYFHGISILPDRMRAGLFSTEFQKSLQGYQAINTLRYWAERSPAQDPLSLVQYIDMKTYLAGDILTKVDRASMAHALEVRVPLLDHKLVEWISSLPPDFKLQGSKGKFIFKKALESKLPEDILYRPKMGFAVPVSNWFRGELKTRVREAVLGSTMADSGTFDMDFLKTLVDQHQAGSRDHSAGLWSLLMFEAFLRQNG